jgi:putative acetyltransferase
VNVITRDERPSDEAAIDRVTALAFKGHAFSSGTESRIVSGLRNADALAVSLVAEVGGEVVGHIAFSPVTIDGQESGFAGLGPLSVRPDMQGRGIGSILVRDGLSQVKWLGAEGCVLLGDPRYYMRFGFRPVPGLVLADAPPEHFLALSFNGTFPAGEVGYHPAFYVTL